MEIILVQALYLCKPLYDRSSCIFDREAYTDWAINACARAARTSADKWEKRWEEEPHSNGSYGANTHTSSMISEPLSNA
jgi:hypothetical protein